MAVIFTGVVGLRDAPSYRLLEKAGDQVASEPALGLVP